MSSSSTRKGCRRRRRPCRYDRASSAHRESQDDPHFYRKGPRKKTAEQSSSKCGTTVVDMRILSSNISLSRDLAANPDPNLGPGQQDNTEQM